MKMEDFVILNLNSKGGFTLSRNDLKNLIISLETRVDYLKYKKLCYRKKKVFSLMSDVISEIDELEHLIIILKSL